MIYNPSELFYFVELILISYKKINSLPKAAAFQEVKAFFTQLIRGLAYIRNLYDQTGVVFRLVI